MNALRVEAVWDDEAKVWVATSKDVPGLVTEAPTAEELAQKLVCLIPELLIENGLHADKRRPVKLHTEREVFLNVACG